MNAVDKKFALIEVDEPSFHLKATFLLLISTLACSNATFALSTLFKIQENLTENLKNRNEKGFRSVPSNLIGLTEPTSSTTHRNTFVHTAHSFLRTYTQCIVKESQFLRALEKLILLCVSSWKCRLNIVKYFNRSEENFRKATVIIPGLDVCAKINYI